MSRIRNSTRNGTLFGKPEMASCPIDHFCARLARTPMTRPPTNVSGMLEKRAEGRGSERLNDQEGQRDRVETDEGQHQDSGDCRERAADDPGDAADSARAAGLHGDEVRIVDDRAHRQAGLGEPEEQVEQDRRDQSDQRDGQLRVGDVDPEEPEVLEPFRKELRHPDRVRAVFDGAQALDEQDQPDRADDFRRGSLL